MKKMNLQLGGIGQMLSREQMKQITGGYDGPAGSCSTAKSCSCLQGDAQGTCGTNNTTSGGCPTSCNCSSSTAPKVYGLNDETCATR